MLVLTYALQIFLKNTKIEVTSSVSMFNQRDLKRDTALVTTIRSNTQTDCQLEHRIIDKHAELSRDINLNRNSRFGTNTAAKKYNETAR